MRQESQKGMDASMLTIAPSSMFKPFSLRDYLPAYKHEKVRHNRSIEFEIICTRSSQTGRVQGIVPRGDHSTVELAENMVLTLNGKEVLLNKSSCLKRQTISPYD